MIEPLFCSKELTLTGVRKLSAASAVSGRHLSADSSRELSASEQGLQALQLYKIKQSARYLFVISLETANPTTSFTIMFSYSLALVCLLS